MDDAFACRDEGWTQDRRRRVAQDLSLASDTDDGQQQVTALYASAVHLIRVRAKNSLCLCFLSFFFPIPSTLSLHTPPVAQLPVNPTRSYPQAALYNNPQSAEDMVALFSDGFHPKLKGGEGRGRESPQHRKVVFSWRVCVSTNPKLFPVAFQKNIYAVCGFVWRERKKESVCVRERERERLCGPDC